MAIVRERRFSFGEVAELYDRRRPSYPSALVQDLISIADLGAGERLLEVGAGTGKATVLFAEHGLPVLAIEPSAEMAAVALRNCAAYPGVSIEQSEFERWQPRGERFPLLYSAQAWHWIDPQLRYVRAREALVDGGTLAAFWNRADWEVCDLRDALKLAYDQVQPEKDDGDPMYPGSARSTDLRADWEHEIGDAPQFGDPEIRAYPWRCEYSTAEYVALLQTHSIQLVEEPGRRQALVAAVAEVLDRNGGTLRLSYVTQLFLARAR